MAIRSRNGGESPSTRQRLDDEELQSALRLIEEKIQSLDAGQTNYDLIQHIEELRKQYLPVLGPDDTENVIVTVASNPASSQIQQIENLYSQALHKHHLENNYLDHADQLIERAIEDRDIPRILLLSQKIQLTARNKALKLAVTHGDKEIVDVLLTSGEISKEGVGEAFQEAAKAGYLDLIRSMIHQKQIPRLHLGWAFSYAAQNGHLDVVNFLLEQPQQLTKTFISFALRWAAEKNQGEIVRTILSKVNISELLNLNQITSPIVDTIFLISTRYGDARVLGILLESREIPENILLRALDVAVESNQPEIVRLLMNLNRINSQNYFSNYSYAIQHGFMEIVEIFLDHPAQAFDVAGAFSLALHHNYQQIAQRILAAYNPSIPRSVRGFLTIEAVRYNQIDLVNMLLSVDSISRLDRDQALRLAQDENMRQLIVSSAMHHQPDMWTISFDDVAKNPRMYLNQVIKHGFPKSISLTDSKGIEVGVVDAGGVRKGFVCLLFKSLASLYNMQNTEIPKIAQDNPHKAEKAMLYEEIGAFLSRLLVVNKRTKDPFLIGPFFHLKFYELIKLVASNPNPAELLKNLAEILVAIDPNYESLANLLKNPDNQQYLNDYSDIAGVDLEDAWSAAQEAAESFLAPVKYLLKGGSESFKNTILTSSFEQIALFFQGVPVTKEALKQALTPEEDPTDLLLEQCSWIKEKIDSEDLPWSIRFIKWATERESLALDTKIYLRKSNGYLFPHTCTNKIDIPTALDNKEDFLAALDSVLDSPLNRA